MKKAKTRAQKNHQLSPQLTNKHSRLLQPTGKPHEVWASIYDESKHATLIGRYHTANFTFASVLELPGLGVQIKELWVDEAAGKIYFIHDGSLLQVTLPMGTPAPSRARAFP